MRMCMNDMGKLKDFIFQNHHRHQLQNTARGRLNDISTQNKLLLVVISTPSCYKFLIEEVD